MFSHETFVRVTVPFFSDWSIYEGMVWTPLLNLTLIAVQFWGLAGLSVMLDLLVWGRGKR